MSVDTSKLSVYNDAMHNPEILRRIIDGVGSQARLARALGVSAQAITKYLKTGVPPKRVIPTERVYFKRTGRRDITRHDIRPDLYPRDEDNNIAA